MAYLEHFHEREKLARIISTEMNTDFHAIIIGFALELLDGPKVQIYTLHEYFTRVYKLLYFGTNRRKICLQDETKILLKILSVSFDKRTRIAQKKLLITKSA